MTHVEENSIHKRCPNCGHKNDPAASKCARCDTSLGPLTTLALPSAAAIDVIQPIVIQPPALSIDQVMFLVAGKQNPVVLTLPPDNRTLTIGRGAANMQPPDLDLSKGGETVSSVSRLHARLDFGGDRPTLTDLRSTNGTWLNENEVVPNTPYPIHNGDLIRLGQQFIFVYFAAGPSAVEDIVLRDQKRILTALTPNVLVNKIGGYLQILAAIQGILNQARQQAPAQIEIREMDVSQAPSITLLRITGSSAAIRLITSTVSPVRAAYSQDADFSDEAAISNELAQLIEMELNTLIPNQSETDLGIFVRQLLPHLRTLVQHTLELSTE